jgi:plastocyanin
MVFSFSTGFAALLCLVAIPSTLAATLDVIVGGPGVLAYSPSSVTAAVGDIVRFSFRQKNHTATQSTLASPCVKLASGFDSGFIPVADTNTQGPFPVAQFTVRNTDPVWVFCAQGAHCKAGMVFAINPGSDFAKFRAAATGSTTATTTATTTGAAAPPSPTGATDHKVVVGGPGLLTYEPNNVKANPGDTVTFEFKQKNHTVTQSTFAAPCRPITATNPGQNGLDSGFWPVADGATTFPTWTVRINDTTPLWFYCKQGNHCGQGMVLAINSVDSGPNNFSAYQAKAKQLNGTATAATPAPTSAAMHVGFGSSLALAMFGVVAGLIL